MHKKIRVGILFGGRSAEHEVSINSARNVFKAIDKEKYEVVPIFIDRQGDWFVASLSIILNLFQDQEQFSKWITDQVRGDNIFGIVKSIDVIFPVLHGTYGEDGTMQGLLKLANIPFVGAGVLGSAVGMDKDVMKRLLRDAGIPIAKFLVFRKDMQGDVILGSGATPESTNGSWSSQDDRLLFQHITNGLGLPFFVKPANLGSSVGVSKVHDESEFDEAIKAAFKYDTKIIIEEFIKGREVECSVLGNEEKIASVPGELIISHEFYSYDAKYLDPHGAVAKIPAELPEGVIKKVQELAIKVCSVLEVDGMGRVDFFVTENNEVFVNEVNTIPGFTDISMYPKMWEASGVSQTELIDRLIQLAFERFEKEKKLKTNL